MNDPADSVRIDAESDEYTVVSVVAVKPTWRDVWSILRGTYRPKVVRRGVMTVAGTSRLLREIWTDDALMRSESPLLNKLKDS